MKTPRSLASVAKQLSDPVVLTDAEGRVEWINAAFTAMCGYTLEEMKGLKPGDLLQGPDTDPAAVVTLHDAVALHRPASVELVNYRKNGEPYVVWITLHPLRDRDGRPAGFMAIERETSAMQRELRRLESEVTELYAILCRVGTAQPA